MDEWALKPNHPDNHLFDTLVGALVAASIEGCRLPTAGLDEARRRVPKVITRETLQGAGMIPAIVNDVPVMFHVPPSPGDHVLLGGTRHTIVDVCYDAEHRQYLVTAEPVHASQATRPPHRPPNRRRARITCARCAGRHWWVYYVRHGPNCIVRCRECRACGYRQRTVEKVVDGE